MEIFVIWHICIVFRKFWKFVDEVRERADRFISSFDTWFNIDCDIQSLNKMGYLILPTLLPELNLIWTICQVWTIYTYIYICNIFLWSRTSEQIYFFVRYKYYDGSILNCSKRDFKFLTHFNILWGNYR